MNRKVEVVKNFRGNEIDKSAAAAIKEEVDKYIAGRPDLNDVTKNNLREFKIADGAAAGDVKVLLGKPDRVIRTGKKTAASETWIYQTSKSSIFDVLIFPVFWGHEEYFLYFKNNILTRIERHYLKQVFSSDVSTRK